MATSTEEIVFAVGSKTDCKRLVENFLNEADPINPSFILFSEKWRVLNFELIYCGRSVEENHQFTFELFSIAKNILFGSNNSYAKRMCGLFLLYGLYYKQRKEKVKIRITLAELKELNKFLETCEGSSSEEAHFIFHKLFLDGAFYFCASSNEHIKTNTKKQSGEEIETAEENGIECTLINCDGLSANNIAELDAIHSRYEELKKCIPDISSQISASTASNPAFVKDLLATINNLKSNIEKSKGNGSKQSKTPAKETTENQGTRRRRIVATSFGANTTSPRRSVRDESSTPKRGSRAKQ